jgi:hypothetical protein
MRYLFVLLCFAFSVHAAAQTGPTYASVAQRKAFYAQLATKYNSPAIREILASDKTNAFEQYIDGHSEEQMIKDYGTVIHELLHGYDDSEFEAHHYFIAPGSKVEVSIGKYYNSKELNSYVRKGTQDSVFRYGLYIGGRSDLHGKAVDLNKGTDSEVMSVNLGIYGILEEYNAYYHDNQAVYELYEYYVKTFGSNNSEAMTTYMGMAEKGTVACYEFRLFVGWYIVNAKKKHPEIYEDMLSNKALRAVFTMIDSKYEALIQQIAARKESLSGKLQADAFSMLDFSGSDADLYKFIELSSEDDLGDPKKLDPMILREYRKVYAQFIKELETMDPDGKLRKFANIPQQIAYLKRLMTPEIHAALEAFRVPGLNEGNWREYVGE